MPPRGLPAGLARRDAEEVGQRCDGVKGWMQPWSRPPGAKGRGSSPRAKGQAPGKGQKRTEAAGDTHAVTLGTGGTAGTLGSGGTAGTGEAGSASDAGGALGEAEEVVRVLQGGP